MDNNAQHLKILSIMYYILGALLGLAGCIPIIHVSLGAMMVFAPDTFNGGKAPPPPGVGWVFIILGAGAMLLSWALAICTILSGRFLMKRTHYLFCLIIAAIICTNMPLGTVLGVFTIIVLMRPEVKAMFQRSATGDTTHSTAFTSAND
jgi:hypothetical protein